QWRSSTLDSGGRCVMIPGTCSMLRWLRLGNSGNRCSGRVEIFHAGQWGTVCDDSWDLDNANVVCRQLGCGAAQSALSSAAFGAGTGPIWLDDVSCSGHELSIADCRHSGFGVHNCGHYEDASVVCEGKVRLANGGNSSCSGRVEIFHFGQWGTVCDDLWDLLDAEVVCRQLGCGRALSAPTRARFGQGSGPIWYDNVMCTGSETKLSECRHQVPPHLFSFLFLSAASPVRLANSGNRCSGRVEMFHAGQWGTVCDDHWDLDNANVVCRQLDCGRAQSALSNAAFGPGRGPIWLDDVFCSGNESLFLSSSQFTEHFLSGQPDSNSTAWPPFPPVNSTNIATVSTTSLPTRRPPFNITAPPGDDTGVEGEVRLANGGNSSCSGRVEIFHFGQWGTVCDDLWDLLDAEVVCRQLGCGRVLSAPTQARFGQGSGPIWYDNVVCTGSETKLSECRHQGIGSHNCGHQEDAGVVCEGKLADSGNRCSGRVEIFHAGQWGTVCDDHWDLDNANVVCRQLDCGRAQSALSNAAFGAVTTTTSRPIYNSSVHTSTPPGNGTGVEGEVRLVNGGNNCLGRVEIFHDGQWGTMCDDLLSLDIANVVCRQLDCGRGRMILSRAAFGAGEGPIWYDDLFCIGNESSISDCRHSGLGVHNCNHNEDISVVCEGKVRLIGGSSFCSGRVEIFHFGQWGTVCDDSWDLLDAEVVCRQLGCGRVLSAPTWAHFGQGSGPIWYDNVMCTGSETKLSECRHQGIGSHNCGHVEDAGVVCEAASPVRLANSRDRCSGRVEIFHAGQWGTVCDDHWDLDNANVVCRQLDCGRAQSALSNAAFGGGAGPIWLDDVSCSGSESSISDCRHSGFGVHNCGHYEDASVICERNGTETRGLTQRSYGAGLAAAPRAPRLRLANGGNSSCSGRVEIFHAGQWGTVCDDHWDLDNANVVCRQLDCGTAQSALSNAAFGAGSGPIWLDDVYCSGNEPSISDCRHSGFGVHNCAHFEDASVICEGNQIRLIGGDSFCSGRVEIFHAGQWGTVCDDHWDLDNANVVCRQLDCGPAQSALSSAAFGAGGGPIWLDDVSCSGNEPSISDCRNSGFGVHNCGHHEDASVICERKRPQTSPPGDDTGVEGEVRLANGGSSSCSGRVEIFHFGQWGTVCDDLWDLLDAEVVCRQLGCGRVLSAPTQARFGQGSGPIWYDNVMCTGSETMLSKCRHQGIGTHNCGHYEDAGVVCEGKYKFVQFVTPQSLHKEMLHRLLTSSSNTSTPWPTFPMESSTNIPATSLTSSGTALPPFDITTPPVATTNWGPQTSPIPITTPPGKNTGFEGEVGLANGGNTFCSGRVEIFHFGQ
uniref:SRCR domain-containing protein n=1 Tax=Salarias fasciatus TaxID=181472 RepID=A0A672HCY3_SALFA